MFAPVMTSRNEEAPLHVVKIDPNARVEFGIYMHEFNTDSQSDMMFTDWLFGGDDLRYEDQEGTAWFDDHEYHAGTHRPDECDVCDSIIQDEIDDRTTLIFSISSADAIAWWDQRIRSYDDFDVDLMDYID